MMSKHGSHYFYNSVIKVVATDLGVEFDNAVMKAIKQVGIDIDKEGLETILRNDQIRYTEAYDKGYDAGFEAGFANAIEKLKEIADNFNKEDQNNG